MSNNQDDLEPSNKTSDLFVRERKRGDTVFAALFFIIVIYFFSIIGDQTKWIDGMPWLKQPRFWPLVCLVGLSVFSFGYLVQSIMAQMKKLDNSIQFSDIAIELFQWVKPLEYGAYFIAYVYILPIIGYLLSTIVFCLFLTFRIGYREKRFFLYAFLTALGIVVLFKTLLQVKIPGGLIYDYLPNQLATFMIVYF